MCGIAGIFYNNENPKDYKDSLLELLYTLRHRGNSHNEIAVGLGWTIGANRLEIVDPLNGRQPIFSSDGRVAVVFNGEIYNYKELKIQLLKKGYTFTTDTDTEVIANAYHCWGLEVFRRLDGMFAILIWDERNNEYVAVRDPMGVKPLYFCHSGDQVIFASEIKALIKYTNKIAIVRPGHYLTGRDGQVKYWHLEPCAITQDVKQNARLLREYISASVKKRLQTDLPVAVFLSGGIDSAVILYEAINHHRNITAFSIGSEYAPDVVTSRKLCSLLDVDFVHVPVSSSDLLKIIPEVIWTIESYEPNHIRGGTLSYYLSKEVAQRGFRLALCGEGADELFGGYREFGLARETEKTDQFIQGLFERFVSELHRTQLQRVDRTSMRFTLEVREPYLDKQIINFAFSLPVSHKVSILTNGQCQGKIILREAYEGILPEWITSREKIVLSLGAGFGGNGPEGIFYTNGMNMISDSELGNLRAKYPEYSIKSHEEAYYFKIFLEKFGEVAHTKERPLVNSTPVST